MDYYRIALTDIPNHLRQLGALGVFARGLVGKGAVELDPDELPVGVLVEGADPDVPDTLTRHAQKLSLCICEF